MCSALSTFYCSALSTRLSLISPSASPSVSLDNLYLGEEAASVDAKSSAVIGGLTITEYEGSPRRYFDSYKLELFSDGSSQVLRLVVVHQVIAYDTQVPAAKSRVWLY